MSSDPNVPAEPAVHHPDGQIEPWARPWGAAVTGALTLGLLGLAGFYLYELGIGASDSPVRVVMSIGLFLLFAAAGAAMPRGWLRGDPWPATLTLVVSALLVPTTWSLLQAGQTLVAIPVGILAITGVVVGWKGRPAQQ